MIVRDKVFVGQIYHNPETKREVKVVNLRSIVLDGSKIPLVEFCLLINDGMTYPANMILMSLYEFRMKYVSLIPEHNYNIGV